MGSTSSALEVQINNMKRQKPFQSQSVVDLAIMDTEEIKKLRGSEWIDHKK